MAQKKAEEAPPELSEKEKEAYDKWPYLYRASEWDSEEIKTVDKSLIDDQEDVMGLEFEDNLFESEFVTFLYAKPKDEEFTRIKPPGGSAKIQISFANKSIQLPDFVADIAPRRNIILEKDDPKGNKINPIPGADIRYASIAPHQSEKDLTVAMLSIWIKPPEGYKSKEQENEEKLNEMYGVPTLLRNEEWQISNLYFAMKTAKETLMFCNAVAKLVFECNDNNKWRVRMIRIQGAGYLNVAKCDTEVRDQIDKERKEADPSDDEDEDDDDDYYYDDSSDEENKEEEEEEEKPPEMTPTEAALEAIKYFMIVDEEQIGLYKTPYSEGPYHDLRLYENPTKVSIDTIYIDKKTLHLEVQKDDDVYMIRHVEGEEESYERIKKLTIDGYVMAKPKNIFVDVKEYDKFHDELRIDTPEKLKAYQRHVLETLDKRNMTFAESMARAKPRYMPRFPPDIPNLPPQPPYPPLYMRNWLKLLITGEHVAPGRELHPQQAILWEKLLAPSFASLLAGGQVAMARIGELEGGFDGCGEDELRDILDDIRDDLIDCECKKALSRWFATLDLFKQDLLYPVKDVPTIEMLRRVYHLPGPVFID